MRGAMVAAVVLAGMAAGLLRSELHTVSGVVVESDGKPIAGARVQHLDPSVKVETDSEGRFALNTRAPAFVIRMPGYGSRYVRTADGTGIRVVLERTTQSLPTCDRKTHCNTIPDGHFCFPHVRGVNAPVGRRGLDAFEQSFEVKGQFLTHGIGMSWSDGPPPDRVVWNAAEYREAVYNDTWFIVDARGKSPQGKYWRSFGKHFESAFYENADQSTAALLDQVLDGVCLLPPKK